MYTSFYDIFYSLYNTTINSHIFLFFFGAGEGFGGIDHEMLKRVYTSSDTE